MIGILKILKFYASLFGFFLTIPLLSFCAAGGPGGGGIAPPGAAPSDFTIANSLDSAATRETDTGNPPPEATGSSPGGQPTTGTLPGGCAKALLVKVRVVENGNTLDCQPTWVRSKKKQNGDSIDPLPINFGPVPQVTVKQSHGDGRIKDTHCGAEGLWESDVLFYRTAVTNEGQCFSHFEISASYVVEDKTFSGPTVSLDSPPGNFSEPYQLTLTIEKDLFSFPDLPDWDLGQ